MGAAEIVIIVLAVLIVVSFIITYVIRKLKGKPTGDCACCPHVRECDHSCSKGHIDLSKYEHPKE